MQHTLEEIFEHVFLRAPHVLGNHTLDDTVLCEDEGLALVVTERIANSDDDWPEFIVFVWLVEMYGVFCTCKSVTDV